MSKKTFATGKLLVGGVHFANITDVTVDYGPSIEQQMLDTLENNLRLLQAIERETGYVTSVTQNDLTKLIAKVKEKYRG